MEPIEFLSKAVKPPLFAEEAGEVSVAGCRLADEAFDCRLEEDIFLELRVWQICMIGDEVLHCYSYSTERRVSGRAYLYRCRRD